MKRKRMTKRIAAIILAAVMMIPTHVTSFAADASAQNNAGQETLLRRTPPGRKRAMPHPVIPRQHSQRIMQQRRMTAVQQVQIPMPVRVEIQDRIHKTAQLQIQRAAQVQIHRTVQVQIHRAIQPIMLLQIRRAVQQQIPTAQILPPVAQPIISQAG